MNFFKLGFFLAGSFILLATNSSACKLTGEMAADALRIKAILDYLTAKTDDPDRSIINIKKTSFETFKVKIKLNDKICEAMMFTAAIQPSCEVEVESLQKKLKC